MRCARVRNTIPLPQHRITPIYVGIGVKQLQQASNAMKIILNGEEKSLENPVTVSQLLADMGMAQKRVAVEVNLEIVPRSEHGQFQLKDADRIEVVQAIGGG